VAKTMLDIYTAQAHAKKSSLDLFSIREREVIQLLAEGRSNKAVSQILGISVKTVETHRSAVMRKLGAKSIPELIRFAVRKKVIEP
jgi:DNA-binding CsgD family transcriptional regulator